MSVVIPTGALQLPPQTVQVTVQTVPQPVPGAHSTCELVQLKEIISVLYQRVMSLEHILKTSVMTVPPMVATLPPLEIAIPKSDVLQDALKKQKRLRKTKASVKKRITKLKKTTRRFCEKNDSRPKKKETKITKPKPIKPTAKQTKSTTTKTINIKPTKPVVIVEKKCIK